MRHSEVDDGLKERCDYETCGGREKRRERQPAETDAALHVLFAPQGKSPGDQPAVFGTQEEHVRERTARTIIAGRLLKNGCHFVAEDLPVRQRVKAKKNFIDVDHRVSLCLPGLQSYRGNTGQLFHAVEFHLQKSSACRGEPVRLLFARLVFGFEALDPAALQQPVNDAIERSGAELHATVTQGFGVFQQRVTMTWRLCEAEQHKENRLS